MADKKISALTGASTPLAGTEVLPIVQGGSTVKVSVDNLTAGRDISASGATFTKAGVTQVTIANTTGTTKNTQLIYADNVGSKWRLGMDVATNNNTVNFQLYSDVGSASYLTMSSAGNLSVDVGNLIIGTAGKGIDFSATSGTGTSELFADYEEGTWTPTDGSGAGLSITGNGAYTKIGRMVYWQAIVIYPTTVNTNDASIAGLPFAINLVSNVAGRSGSTITATDEATLVQSLQIETSNIVRFYKAGFVQNTNAELSGNQIYCAGFYST